MIPIKHPTLPVQELVPDHALDSWLAAGWQKVLTDAQESRLDEIQLEVELMACPTCGASGDEPCVTAAGNPAAGPHATRLESTHSSPAAATAADQGQHSDEGEEA